MSTVGFFIVVPRFSSRRPLFPSLAAYPAFYFSGGGGSCNPSNVTPETVASRMNTSPLS